jgi:arylsulfatase A-like enzyme
MMLAFGLLAPTIGMMGGRTPNIDRLANEGALFTDYYAQQSCTAGRSAFITGQHPFRTGLLAVGLPGSPLGLQKEDPIIADLLKPLGDATAQVGKNHLGDRNEFLPTVHGFDEFYGNLYHLNSEEEPEDPDYPKNPTFHEKFDPRGVLRCVALTSDNPAPADPRFGAWGKQKCEDTGPLTRQRMETIEEDLLQVSLDFMDKSVKSGKPFFLWHNTTRMHVWTRLSPRWENKSGYGLYADGMMELDWVVGQLLKKLDDLGIANNTIVVFTSDNGAQKVSWPDGGTEPFRGEKGTTWEGGFRVPCLARWPGVIKPNTIINDIASHEDWTPTFLAAAGVPDVKEQLLKGYKGVDQTFKVHLDAYDMTDLLSGKGPGQRKEILYCDDSGGLNAKLEYLERMKRFSRLSLFSFLFAAVLAFAQQSEPSTDKSPAQSGVSGLPLNFARHTGDLDEMVKRGSIRALVLYSRSGFFYVDGKPEGISYEALQYFEQFLNQKLRTRQHIQVTFIPVRPDQLGSYLNEGIGDLIAYPVAMTPGREQQVAFSVPLETGVKQILVTGKDFGPVASL